MANVGYTVRMIMKKPPSDHDEWLEESEKPLPKELPKKKPTPPDRKGAHRSIDGESAKNWGDELHYGD